MNPPAKPKLSHNEWRKTPYADTDTKDPERAVRVLLEKYGVKSMQWTEGQIADQGGEERPHISLRFILDGRSYRISMKALWANTPADQLGRQLKRAIYWTLKPLLEGAKVFFDAEQVLLGFLEMENGATMYEIAQNRLPTTGKGVKDLLMLPNQRSQA